MGARMVAKKVVLHSVSGTDCPTIYVADSRRRGLDVTAGIGAGFCGKVSWSGSEVLLLRDSILKREPQAETVARESRCRA